jgi:hypothetical protein
VDELTGIFLFGANKSKQVNKLQSRRDG